jgi:IS30 family transposase
MTYVRKINRPERDATIIRMYTKERGSMNGIRKKINVSAPTIKKILQRNNIPQTNYKGSRYVGMD